MQIPRTTLVLAVLVAGGCVDQSAPTMVEPGVLVGAADGTLGRTNGGGHYAIDLGGGLVLDAQFGMSVWQVDANENALGNFHHRTELFGDAIDFHGVATCLSIDAANGRAWIGGVITQNRSVREPFASGDIYQPGKDIWFRVLDEGQPSEGVDRTTFVGFEGGAGIPTSAEYCEQRPWPAGNARTNALTSGNLKVMP